VGRLKSFRAALKNYESSEAGDDPDRRAHLQRWRDDDHAEEVWREINSAAQKNGKVLPAVVFIREILGARRVAIAIANRGKLRDDYRKAAYQMQRIADFFTPAAPLRHAQLPAQHSACWDAGGGRYLFSQASRADPQ
jgi:hypothetical protein